jgi:hypothetical protein
VGRSAIKFGIQLLVLLPVLQIIMFTLVSDDGGFIKALLLTTFPPSTSTHHLGDQSQSFVVPRGLHTSMVGSLIDDKWGFINASCLSDLARHSTSTHLFVANKMYQGHLDSHHHQR